MCLLSHRRFFISNSLIFAQLRAYLLVFACLFAFQSLFSHSLHMFAPLHALSRNDMRINTRAKVLAKHKGAKQQSPKRQSRLYYFTPLGASDIKGPSQTADTWGLSPSAACHLGRLFPTTSRLRTSPMTRAIPPFRRRRPSRGRPRRS